MSSEPSPPGEERHLGRAVVIWAILSVVGVLAVVFLLGPHMPPGDKSEQASDQTTANVVLAAVMTPIAIAVWTFFGYALIVFGRSRGEGDGPYDPGHSGIQLGWLVGSTVIVLALAGYGTYALYATSSGASGAGAGGGQGPDPIAAPGGRPLQVQVIAQQWQFTYRYPQYHGVETFSLALPVDRSVEFRVTSLDVVHSFWAYELGVKADAVPGAENIAFANPDHVGRFTVRCAELCGLWHGGMRASARVLTKAGFDRWIARQVAVNAPSLHYLPRYAHTYFPAPPRRAG